MAPIIAAFLPTIIEKIFGKKEKQVIEGVVKSIRISKGVVGSKTGKVAAGTLIAELIAIMAMSPDITWTIILVLAAFAHTFKDVILRAVTKEPV